MHTRNISELQVGQRMGRFMEARCRGVESDGGSGPCCDCLKFIGDRAKHGNNSGDVGVWAIKERCPRGHFSAMLKVLGCRQTPQYQAREHPRTYLFEWIESWYNCQRRQHLTGPKGCVGNWADWQKETLSQQDHPLGCTELAGIEAIKVCS